MSHSPALIRQPYAIPLLDEEAALLHSSGDDAITQHIAVTIQPIGGRQETLVVPANELRSVLISLDLAAENAKESSANKRLIDVAENGPRRIKIALVQERILRIATIQSGDIQQAVLWYTLTPIPALDGKVASDLVAFEARGAEVEAYLSQQGIFPEK